MRGLADWVVLFILLFFISISFRGIHTHMWVQDSRQTVKLEKIGVNDFGNTGNALKEFLANSSDKYICIALTTPISPTIVNNMYDWGWKLVTIEGIPWTISGYWFERRVENNG